MSEKPLGACTFAGASNPVVGRERTGNAKLGRTDHAGSRPANVVSRANLSIDQVDENGALISLDPDYSFVDALHAGK